MDCSNRKIIKSSLLLFPAANRNRLVLPLLSERDPLARIFQYNKMDWNFQTPEVNL